jgi:hypothetical protein
VISRGRSRQHELRSQLAHAADVPHTVFAHPDPAVQSAQIVERIPYVAAHIETYRGGVLRDEWRALFERYEPRLLEWLDDRVVRHRQTPD